MSISLRSSLRKAALLVALLGAGAQGATFTWDGGNGEWVDPKWNTGNYIADLVGTSNGSNGYKGLSGEQEDFVINSGVVTYDANAIASDFRLKQGASLTINTGATWVQPSDDSWSENRWTEMDPTLLNINGGKYVRSGSVNDEGGGALIFGSWRGDDNFDHPLSGDHQDTEIRVVNGGRLESEGQVWFGAWGDVPRNGTKITMIINNGTVDLTGGDVAIDPDEIPAPTGDLIFTNHHLDEVDQPTYVINFTGPGSFIVDSSGIYNTYLDGNTGEWQGLTPVSYQDLWDEGILQADGKSGKTGANFSQYFTVTGAVGQDNYTLTRSANPVLVGDFDSDGDLDVADVDMLSVASASGANEKKYDLNNDNLVNGADIGVWAKDLRKVWIGDADVSGEFNSGDFVNIFTKGKYETGDAATYSEGDWDGDGKFTSGDFVAAFTDGGYEVGPRAAVAAVPEPSSLVMIGLGLLGLAGRRRR